MRTTKGMLFTRKTKKHGNVYCLFYQQNGQRKKLTLKDDHGQPITNRRDAEKTAGKVMAPLRITDELQRKRAVANEYRDAMQIAADLEETNREKLTIAEAWERFLESTDRPQCSEVMLQDYARRWRNFTDWLLAEYSDIQAVESVTRTHAREFVKKLDRSGISANRRNKILQGCRLVFAVLSEDCNNMANPFHGIKNRTLTTRSHRELSEGELLKVCQTAKGELRTLFATGLYTAMRLGDACLLRWEDIMLDRGRLAITPRKTRRTGKAIVLPLHPVLRSILEETPIQERAGYVVPKLADRYSRDPGGVCKMLRRHFESCGITTQERYPDQKQATCLVGFHSLRHSFVSLCAARGVPLPIVQELCGHGSPAIQRHYIHIGEDAASQAMAALPSFTDTDQPEDRRAKLHRIIDQIPEERVAAVLEFARNV